MLWAIVVSGKPSAELVAYLRGNNFPRFLISYNEFDPFQAHELYPGYDFLVVWNQCVVPKAPLPSLETLLDFSKINVTWDSYGRNYPHRTAQRFSLDLIGLPKGATRDMFEAQNDLHILPKDLNVSEGYAESKSARIVNIRKQVVRHILPYVKVFDAVRGCYV